MSKYSDECSLAECIAIKYHHIHIFNIANDLRAGLGPWSPWSEVILLVYMSCFTHARFFEVIFTRYNSLKMLLIGLYISFYQNCSSSFIAPSAIVCKRVLPWCVFFSASDLLILGVLGDLESYYNDGYSYDIKVEQTCNPVAEGFSTSFLKVHPLRNLRKKARNLRNLRNLRNF